MNYMVNKVHMRTSHDLRPRVRDNELQVHDLLRVCDPYTWCVMQMNQQILEIS